MAVDQPWREVQRVIRRGGWVRKVEGKGAGTSHEPYVSDSYPGKVLNIPKHGKDGIVKAVYIQEIIEAMGRENCPEYWAG